MTDRPGLEFSFSGLKTYTLNTVTAEQEAGNWTDQTRADIALAFETAVVETLVMLVAITILAALVVAAARRVGVGRSTGPLELVGRLPLDGRRAVYLVRVDKTVFVLGASEAGLRKLGEFAGDDLDFSIQRAPLAFRDVFDRALAKKKPASDSDAA